jgi:membrane protease subunit (stomatin/prohibitin family)
MQTQNDVVRVESMTLRVWRARIESVVFGKDSARQVTAMFGTAEEARRLAGDLSEFAAQQSVFIAPRANEDQRRLAALQATEAQLQGNAAAMAPGVSRLKQAGDLHEALRIAAAHETTGTSAAPGGARFCAACGARATASARFCADCGQALT